MVQPRKQRHRGSKKGGGEERRKAAFGLAFGPPCAMIPAAQKFPSPPSLSPLYVQYSSGSHVRLKKKESVREDRSAEKEEKRRERDL